MIGRIIAEEEFLHQGLVHHLFVSAIEGAACEFRFEVRCTPAGENQPQTLFEKTIDFSDILPLCPNTTLDQLIEAEARAIRLAVVTEEDLHAHDP